MSDRRNSKSAPRKRTSVSSSRKSSTSAEKTPLLSAASTPPPPAREKHCYYFEDGVRQVDFVLVYENLPDYEAPPEDKSGVYRDRFMQKLRQAGLHLEKDVSKSRWKGKETVFVLVHVPFDTMCSYAEELSIKAPLQVQPNPTVNFSAKLMKRLKIPNRLVEPVEYVPPDYYTCNFKKSKFHKFLGHENPEDFFFTRDRGRVANEILQTTVYGKRRRAEIGIDQLIERGIFTAAFPLHDGPFEVEEGTEGFQYNERQILSIHWAAWGKWAKYQPMDNIKEYFGEKIGLYFAWLGFYTAWLLPASIVGVLVFLYGIVAVFYYEPANVVCSSGAEYTMCPIAEGSGVWFLNTTCLNYRISYLFDHGGTVFYAIFMSLWAVCFLENWKRKNAALAHRWDCLGYEEEEERPRPEFVVRAPKLEENPVTGQMEPHFPASSRIPRIVTSLSAILIMVVFVVLFIVAVIIYRTLIQQPLSKDPTLQPYNPMMTSLTAAVFNLILIMVLSHVYNALAKLLTDWEMHRTQTEYEDNLIIKVFIFQFCNFYSSIIYIGFFKGQFVGYPGHYTTFLGLRNEECGPGGCFIELAQQLGVILVGKQMIGNIQELLIPKLKGWWMRRKQKKQMQEKEDLSLLSPWERDYRLIPNEGLFEEYLEMVLQFGFITIFVAAFPLAPLFALLNNWVEIRLDASKLVRETRRPVSEKAEDIGVWFTILDVLVQLAVIANAFLIAFTSSFIDETFYAYSTGDTNLTGYINHTLSVAKHDPDVSNATCHYRGFRDEDGHHTRYHFRLLCVKLAFVIVFEHVVFFVSRLIDIMVPDIPESVALKIKRENYLGKRALAERAVEEEGGEED